MGGMDEGQKHFSRSTSDGKITKGDTKSLQANEQKAGQFVKCAKLNYQIGKGSICYWYGFRKLGAHILLGRYVSNALKISNTLTQ